MFRYAVGVAPTTEVTKILKGEVTTDLLRTFSDLAQADIVTFAQVEADGVVKVSAVFPAGGGTTTTATTTRTTKTTTAATHRLRFVVKLNNVPVSTMAQYASEIQESMGNNIYLNVSGAQVGAARQPPFWCRK